MSENEDIVEWWRALVESGHADQDAIDQAFQQFENADLIGRVVVHRYRCRKRACLLATVIRLGGDVLVRTVDYKLAPGTNLARSVETARAKNTLDGNRHWPGHTFNVRALAEWGDRAGMDMNCRHGLRVINAGDILRQIEGVTPGHPRAPSHI